MKKKLFKEQYSEDLVKQVEEMLEIVEVKEQPKRRGRKRSVLDE